MDWERAKADDMARQFEKWLREGSPEAISQEELERHFGIEPPEEEVDAPGGLGV